MIDYIKLIQWNIWVKENPENISKFLKETDADIICAQELIKDSKKNLDVAKYLAKELGFEYFYHDGETWDNRQEKEAQGNAIFSRFPIVNTNYIYVQQPKHNPINASSEGRVYIEATIKVDGKELIVGTTHLSYSDRFVITDQRKKEVDVLLSILKDKKSNYIFAGDLNSASDSYTISEIEKLLLHSGPAYTQKSWTTKPFEYKGFQEYDLNWRLDYVFNSKDISIIDSEILACPYSDHLPVQIKIKIKE